MSIEKNIRTISLQQPHFFFHLSFVLIDWMYTYICPCLATVHTSDIYMCCKNEFSLVAHKNVSWQSFTSFVLGIKKLVNGEVHRGRICTFLAAQVSRTALLMCGYLYMTVFSGSIGLVVTYCWKVYLFRRCLKGVVY